MSSSGPRTRPPLPVLPVMTARHRLPDPAEPSSPPRASPASSSAYWPSPSPSTTTYACHSASSSQSSFDASSHTSVRSRAPRPLPQIPNSPSVSSPSPCGGVFACPRPLPVPPPQSPPLIREPGPSNQPLVRPLPLPRSPDHCSPPSPPLPPALRVSLPVSGLAPATDPERTISPFSPMSPIVFRSAASLETASPEEERAPRRFSTAAPREEQPASTGDIAPRRVSQGSAATLNAESETPAVSTLRLSRCETVQMVVELVPLRPAAKRTSRFWMVEKKGKRWVEDDYNEILQELRLL